MERIVISLPLVGTRILSTSFALTVLPVHAMLEVVLHIADNAGRWPMQGAMVQLSLMSRAMHAKTQTNSVGALTPKTATCPRIDAPTTPHAATVVLATEGAPCTSWRVPICKRGQAIGNQIIPHSIPNHRDQLQSRWQLSRRRRSARAKGHSSADARRARGHSLQTDEARKPTSRMR